MDDDVVGVDQHPIRGWEPLDPNAPSKSLLDLVGKLNGHRRDLPRRAARSDHHMVCNVRFARQRDRHDLLRLVVVERLKNELVEVFDGVCTAGGGFSGMFGQVVSWRTGASSRARYRTWKFGDASLDRAREWRLQRSDRGTGEG